MAAHANLPDPMDEYGWIEETTRLGSGEDLPSWRDSSNDTIYQQTVDDAAHLAREHDTGTPTAADERWAALPPVTPAPTLNGQDDLARTGRGWQMKWAEPTADVAADAAELADAQVERWIDEAAATGDVPSWPGLAASDDYDTPIPFTAPAWLTVSRAEAYDDYDAAIPFHVVDAYTRHMTGDDDGHDL